METKYGNITNIYDLFEKEVETSRSPGQGGDVIYAKATCKICADEVKGMSELGACFISDQGENLHLLSGQKRSHIELHKTLANLNLSE